MKEFLITLLTRHCPSESFAILFCDPFLKCRYSPFWIGLLWLSLIIILIEGLSLQSCDFRHTNPKVFFLNSLMRSSHSFDKKKSALLTPRSKCCRCLDGMYSLGSWCGTKIWLGPILISGCGASCKGGAEGTSLLNDWGNGTVGFGMFSKEPKESFYDKVNGRAA